MSAVLKALEGEKYLSVETSRKDGSPVRTPVWFIPLDERLFFATGGDSFKVKRLNRNPKARIAACDMRGNVHGSWWDATAEVLPEGELAARAQQAVQKKYGLVSSLAHLWWRLTGKLPTRRVIAIRPVEMAA